MSSPGSSFSIDLERAPQAIEELRAAKQELLDIREQALELGRVDPGSGDSVSIDAAAVIGAVAVSGPRSLVAALEAGAAQIQTLIDGMSAELTAYEAAEGENATAFRT